MNAFDEILMIFYFFVFLLLSRGLLASLARLRCLATTMSFLTNSYFQLPGYSCCQCQLCSMEENVAAEAVEITLIPVFGTQCAFCHCVPTSGDFVIACRPAFGDFVIGCRPHWRFCHWLPTTLAILSLAADHIGDFVIGCRPRSAGNDKTTNITQHHHGQGQTQ